MMDVQDTNRDKADSTYELYRKSSKHPARPIVASRERWKGTFRTVAWIALLLGLVSSVPLTWNMMAARAEAAKWDKRAQTETTGYFYGQVSLIRLACPSMNADVRRMVSKGRLTVKDVYLLEDELERRHDQYLVDRGRFDGRQAVGLPSGPEPARCTKFEPGLEDSGREVLPWEYVSTQDDL